MSRILCIFRAERFSPNSVEKDQKIMLAVAEALKTVHSHTVTTITEEEFVRLDLLPDTELCLTMARSREAIDKLRQMDCPVINSPEGITTCSNRYLLNEEMRKIGTPLPGSSRYPLWLKRGDGTAEDAKDILFCSTAKERHTATKSFKACGITDIVVQEHVEGDLVKFYGIASTPFFHTIYPTDTGRSKFGDESINGQAHHYPYDAAALKQCGDHIANHVGIDIYGGDAIVKADGTFVIIDFNDWPSFSSCRDEASATINTLISKRL